MSETVKLTRKRPTDYYVNYNNGIKNIPYKWSGATTKKEHTLQVPREVFDWLNMNTTAIKSGDLVIADTEPLKDEIINNEIVDAEEYLANSHSRDEIIALLKGNINKMKKELNLVTSRQEKQFVKQIADELNNSEEGLNSTKYNFIVDWVKIKKDENE